MTSPARTRGDNRRLPTASPKSLHGGQRAAAVSRRILLAKVGRCLNYAGLTIARHAHVLHNVLLFSVGQVCTLRLRTQPYPSPRSIRQRNQDDLARI
jgi:hypothetical protein